MVRQLTSGHVYRNLVFTDQGIEDPRYNGRPVGRNNQESQGSKAYTSQQPRHDPCPRFNLSEVLASVRARRAICCIDTVESWIHARSDLFIRAPLVQSPTSGSITLTWSYDRQILRLAFTPTAVFVNEKPVSRGEAAEALIAWNRRLIDGESRRIREAGVPVTSPVYDSSDLTEAEDEW